MFSHIDPAVSELLQQRGLLTFVDRTGRAVGGDEAYLSLLGPVPLPIDIPGGDEAIFNWYAFVRRAEFDLIRKVSERVRSDDTRDLVPLLSTYMQVSSILIHGDFADAAVPLVRVHSCCMTSDVFGSLRCECGPQLRESLRRVAEEGVGAVVYLSSHEGRGIGLWAKAATYLLQDMGQDTYQANIALGLPEDSRDFGDAAVVLRTLRPKHPQIRLLTNNPLKVEELQRGGIEVTETVPLVLGFGEHNLRYMRSKASKGHKIPDDALSD